MTNYLRFILPTLILVAGSICLGMNYSTVAWILFGVGGVLLFIMSYDALIDVFTRKADATSRLFDSAKYIPYDERPQLLYALGLPLLKQANEKTTLTINTGSASAVEKTRILPDLPVSSDQLAKLAHGLIIERAPLSRREWVDRRGVFTDQQYRNMQAAFSQRGLIELRDPANSNSGYVLTSLGKQTMDSMTLPSPTPPEEIAYNPQ